MTTSPFDALSGGCRGGLGSEGALGGGAGGALQLTVAGTLRIDGTLSSNGGGGQLDSNDDGGGGGGGSGGDLYLQVGRLVIGDAGALTAQGGGGGSGGGVEAGVDGPTDPTMVARGGGAVASDATSGGDGAGGAGSGALIEAQPGVSGAGSKGAGGGGGGVGRITLSLGPASSCAALPLWHFSPSPLCR